MKLHQSLDTKEIGARIKQLRKARSLKQDDLGEVLGGISRGQVSNLETGKRNINIHQIKLLADFFGVSLETLGVKTNKVETIDKIIYKKNTGGRWNKDAVIDLQVETYDF